MSNDSVMVYVPERRFAYTVELASENCCADPPFKNTVKAVVSTGSKPLGESTCFCTVREPRLVSVNEHETCSPCASVNVTDAPFCTNPLTAPAHSRPVKSHHVGTVSVSVYVRVAN